MTKNQNNKKIKKKRYFLSYLMFGSFLISPISLMISCSTKTKDITNVEKQHVKQYMNYEDLKNVSNARVWDMTVQERMKTVYTRFEAITPVLFKTRVESEAEVKILPNGESELKKPRVTKMKFDALSSVIIDQGEYDDYDSFEDDFKGHKTKKMVFKIVSGIKWINSQGKKTKYNFKAIDFFYGWLRALYASEEARRKGTVKGKNSFSPLSSKYLTTLELKGEFYKKNETKEFTVNTEYDSGLVYLFNLFNIDIAETVKQNTGKNENVDEFKLIFTNDKAGIDIIEGLIANINVFTAASSEKIEEMRGDNVDVELEPGKYIQLGEYGQRISEAGSDKIDLTHQLLVSRYYFENYDITPNSKGIILKKNIHSYDKEFNKRQNTINKYQILSFRNEDKDTFWAKRQSSFLKDNSESILFSGVESSSSLMTQIKNSNKFRWTNNDKTGLIRFLMFNPLYMINTSSYSLSSNALQLLFGEKVKNNILSSKTADDEYFLGRGRRFRALLNASINLQAISADLWPSSEEVKTANTYYQKQPLTLITNKESYYDYEKRTKTKLNTPIYSATDEEMREHIKNNVSGSATKKYETIEAVRKKVKLGWIKLLEDAKLENKKVEIPLYEYFATDLPQSARVISVYEKIISELNKVTPYNLTFVKFNATETKEANNYYKRGVAPLVRVNLGRDYRSSASLIQQLIGSYYGYGVGAQVLKQVLELTGNNNKIDDIFEYKAKFDFSTLKTFITNNSSKYDKLTLINAKNITLEDWQKFRLSSFNKSTEKNKIDFFNQLDDLFTKYFKDIVADNKNLLVKWSKFAASFAIENKLSLTVKKLASITIPYTGTSPIKRIYQSTWMNLTPGPGVVGNDFQLADSWVKLN